ncbi:MAG: glucuronate isomerase [Acidimicrobiales bacterium]|jgi:glucuronate isomerase
MSAAFLDEDFLLEGDTARMLFHEVAENAPIVDLHNHLSAADIAADRVYETLADLWLGGDHYKWRAMRLAGFGEELITGGADPWDKFSAWAATVPRLIRNPLYIWTHLELRRVFGIDLPLGPSTAREIWDEANRQLPNWSSQKLLSRFRVRAVATTDDPTDDLSAHRSLREQVDVAVAVIPTFRPDGAHRLLDDPGAWNSWSDRLSAASEVAVDDLDSLLFALARSYGRFVEMGARASDNGLSRLPDKARDPTLADSAVRRVRQGIAATPEERDAVMLEVLAVASRLAFADESVLQLHLGPLRDISPRILALVGRDVGADAMDDQHQAPGLARFLGGLERDGALPRTVLYNANPGDNALFATLAGAFSRPGVAPLVQWGPPWWFNDHEGGMRRQLDDLSDKGQLAGFIGMLTDSRSLLSMTRHELFRRVLCGVIGRDVEEGRVPADIGLCSNAVRDICVANAVRYFGLPNAWAQ